MPNPEWTYKHATDLRDHWWWRPGWQVGTRFYTWHITFDGQDQLHRLVDTYQAELARHPYLDLIPHQWLHLTMQGVGRTANITTDQINSLPTATGPSWPRPVDVLRALGTLSGCLPGAAQPDGAPDSHPDRWHLAKQCGHSRSGASMLTPMTAIAGLIGLVITIGLLAWSHIA